ncbi:unnamed protein product [Schistosoma margrebowiei]|uniref:Serine/threonine-protein kinase ULK3 n=1 Tax=Schistosoma margrebowiei TaxID=48269 RepID=A0AA85ABJ3_9TREM|nr:unnamed protein product [Schistosoma margrebowiei]
MIKVPGFVISQLLGRGTYGQVYMGRKSGSSKLVAIKCIMKLKLSNQARDNLVSEISILKALEHPHIVRMLDFTWDASFVYIIMEFCGGGDLSRFLRLKKRLDELLVQRFLQQLALALQYLKSKNIVHMDLKPQNILLTSINNPSLKLADFGFAQCIKETAKKNEVRGTLLYMAPEIFCDGFYHPSCDLWSIGIILYECLFGTTPYGQITIEQLKEKLVAMDEQIKLPSPNEISKPCAALIHGLLRRNPSERLNHEQFFSHPFIDLDHAPSAQSLDKAAEYLKRAPQLESLGKLCEAYDCYLEGLNHLMAAYNYEPSRFKKSQIRNLMKDHLLKTESLKLELCLLSHTDVTSSSSPQLEPKTLNSQAVNLPDPIVPVKCYDVSRQPKKNADSSKKGLFHYLPKEKDDHQSSLKSKSSPTSETYQPQDSDKAGILTRIKHWFSRQNDKTENPYEYSGKAKPVPTAILVEVDHSSSTQLPLESLHSPAVLPSSPSPCPNSTNTIEQEESLALNQSVNSSTIEPAIESSVKTTSLDSSKFRDSYLESGPNVDSTDMVDGLTEKFDRSRLLELGTSSNIVVEFLDKFYKLISTHRLQEALIYFQNEFSNCLKEAQNDSNSKNRSILFKELNLAMDKAEQIKAKLNCNSTMMIGENESSFQIGEEVLDENPQEEDHCLLM